ncbi:hypothetical protein IDM48_04275 [Rothia amarae]|uniref:AlpA family phage regulatory protein n=1 Tax=Rothia amarae TaxID=169480 RepID=A0A7H2BLS9_9MICC|nr:hypothetical protein [Rothia amarae]QNV40625.1 hypothetical protein IDM48_04275 [Rothia amarae]
MKKRFYSARELVEMGLFNSTSYIYQERARGRFPLRALTFGNRRDLLFDAADVEAYIGSAVKR